MESTSQASRVSSRCRIARSFGSPTIAMASAAVTAVTPNLLRSWMTSCSGSPTCTDPAR